MAASRLDDLARHARFVFLGTVIRLNAATEPAVPVTANTAVVRVEEVLHAPAALGEQTGREVTVQLREGQAAREGQQAVFFTNPWLYGEGLAVVELDRRESRERARLREQVRTSAEREADAALQERLAAADLVLVGTVISTRPLTPGRGPLGSEHDPEWWEATLAVASVLKGAASGPTVRVLFAASMDVLWFQAPKPRVGQDGIWLLHRESIPGLNVEAHALMHPLDALPTDQVERVRRLLRGGPATPTAG